MDADNVLGINNTLHNHSSRQFRRSLSVPSSFLQLYPGGLLRRCRHSSAFSLAFQFRVKSSPELLSPSEAPIINRLIISGGQRGDGLPIKIGENGTIE